MKKKITLLAIFISFGVGSLCQVNLSDQQAGLDSLLGVWNDDTKSDTNRLQALQLYAKKGFMYSQPDSALKLAQISYDFAKSKGLSKQMSNSLHIQGVSSYFLGDYSNSIDFYIKNLKIINEIGNKKREANTLNNLGIVYFRMGDYAKSIDYYTQSLLIYEELEYNTGIALAQNNIGVIHENQGNFEEAITFYNRSLNIDKEIGNKRGIGNTLNNIGLMYFNQSDYTRALDYYKRSLSLREEINYNSGIISSLNNIGSVYEKNDNNEIALDYFMRSLKLAKEIGDKHRITATLNYLGNLYIKMGDYNTAISYCESSLKIAKEVGVAIEIRDAANVLYDAYKSAGMNKPALEMYELYIATRDSIDSEENQKEVIRQKYKYDYDKKAIADSVAYLQVQKVQNAKLEKSRILQFALIGGVTSLLIFLVYVFNRYRITRKQQLIISEQNKELAIATDIAETANSDLRTKSEELEKFNSTMLDREMRIIELKEEANQLAKSNNMEIPYPEVKET